MDSAISTERRVKGHRRQVEFLKALHEYPSSMIFAGPEGIGKQLVAKLYFELLNRGSKYGEEAVEEGDYSKFRVYAPDKGRRFTVDQVRGITRAAEDHPHPFRHQVIVLDAAEKLTFEAASALLKTLEDPPFGHARFVLLTTSFKRMLPTVRSRSQRLDFFPITTKEVQQILQDRGTEQAKELAAISGGSPGRALMFAGSRALQIRNGLLSFFLAGPNMILYSAFQFIDSIETEHWPLVVMVLESLVVDLVMMKSTGEVRFNTDQEAEFLKRVQTSSQAVGWLVKDLSDYIAMAGRPLNHKVQLKALLLSSMCYAKGQRLV